MMDCEQEGYEMKVNEELTEEMLASQRYFAVQAKAVDSGLWYTAHEEEDRSGYEIYSDLDQALAWMEKWARDCKDFADLPAEFRVVELIVNNTISYYKTTAQQVHE
jgi:hypothetical protein